MTSSSLFNPHVSTELSIGRQAPVGVLTAVLCAESADAAGVCTIRTIPATVYVSYLADVVVIDEQEETLERIEDSKNVVGWDQ